MLGENREFGKVAMILAITGGILVGAKWGKIKRGAKVAFFAGIGTILGGVVAGPVGAVVGGSIGGFVGA